MKKKLYYSLPLFIILTLQKNIILQDNSPSSALNNKQNGSRNNQRQSNSFIATKKHENSRNSNPLKNKGVQPPNSLIEPGCFCKWKKCFGRCVDIETKCFEQQSCETFSK